MQRNLIDLLWYKRRVDMRWLLQNKTPPSEKNEVDSPAEVSPRPHFVLLFAGLGRASHSSQAHAPFFAKMARTSRVSSGKTDTAGGDDGRSATRRRSPRGLNGAAAAAAGGASLPPPPSPAVAATQSKRAEREAPVKDSKVGQIRNPQVFLVSRDAETGSASNVKQRILRPIS